MLKEIIKVEKLTELEAIELCGYHNLDWEEHGQIVRQCSCCGAYVHVDEQSGEAEINGYTYFDICDQCQSEIESDIVTEVFDF